MGHKNHKMDIIKKPILKFFRLGEWFIPQMCSNYINATEDNHMNMFAKFRFAKFIKLLFEVKRKIKT
jgi:hypothetical protein